MRAAHVLLPILLATSGFAASKLGHDVARKRISELGSSTLVLDAVEIRQITQQSADRAIVETTITLAFQFTKSEQGAWVVDAIRFGDRDWVNMSELLNAINHGNPPVMTASPS